MPSYESTLRISSLVRIRKSKSAMIVKDILSGAVEVEKGRVFYKAFSSDPRSSGSGNLSTLIASNDKTFQHENHVRQKIHFFNVDSELVYWNFFLDFGPLNLGQLYRFCDKLNSKLRDPRLSDHVICFFSNTTYQKRANAMYLLAGWQVLYRDRSPEEACALFRDAIYGDVYDETRQNSPRSVTKRHETGETLAPIPAFHDASPCECTYNLNLLDCLRGLVKARSFNFFSFDTFNLKEYEYFEQVENGDLSWIVKDKIIAFAGPHFQRKVTQEGCYALSPQDYIPYFQKKNIGLVVRLNKRMYDENDFRKAGIEHFEQYYLDGSCPTMPILQNILRAFESVPAGKGFAVHCKAGLGRTGTCIGAYLMKHFKFSAKEVIGWMRICRPGMVIGPQQHFLENIEAQMWYEGDLMRLHPAKNAVSVSSSSFFRNWKGEKEEDMNSNRDQMEEESTEGQQADSLLSRKIMGHHH